MYMSIQIQTALLVCVGGKSFKVCDNFQQASAIISLYILTNNFGASKFYSKKNIGKIYHHTKGVIAYVSYNGRVWKHTANTNKITTQEEVSNLLANDIN